MSLITIIGAVSCFILCNEDSEIKEQAAAELAGMDPQTREAYALMLRSMKSETPGEFFRVLENNSQEWLKVTLYSGLNYQDES